jgi:PAS domain S-box-containing protein
MPSIAKILIVEDELVIAGSMGKTLEKAGYVVSGIASSAREALDAAANGLPDLVLMDIRIKGPQDGIEAARLIQDRFEIPVIFLTAYADDETLDRAKLAGPFGYLVKPVSQESLVTAIEVALYKHAMDRKLDEHRAWLVTILQTSAESVIVTDIQGRVQLLNRSAEKLTGLSQSQARGGMLDDLLSMKADGLAVSAQYLLARTIQEGRTLSLPLKTVLRTQNVQTAIRGQFAASVGESGVAVGGVITLHDVTAENLEEQHLRQDQKMRLLGHFAEAVSEDFGSLLDLISACAADLEKHLPDIPRFDGQEDFAQNIIGIQESTQIAATIARLLLNLANNPKHSPELLKMSVVVEEATPLLQQLAGSRISLSVQCASDLGTVFGDSNQMEQLLVNLVLNARERLAQRGTIRIVVDNGVAGESFVRIMVTAVQSSDADQAWAALTFPFQMDSPPLTLSLVSAIVTAAEGSLRSYAPDENSNLVEILLPRKDAQVVTGSAMVSSKAGSVILIGGLDVGLAAPLSAEFKRLGYVVLEAKNARNALFVAGLYGSEITAVIVDGLADASQRREVKDGLSGQRRPAILLRFSSFPEVTADGWQTLVKPIDVEKVAEAVEIALHAKDLKSRAAFVS